MDCFTDWPVIISMDHGTTTSQLITVLRQSFCRTGIPEIIWSDGGPQFTSNMFQEFAKQWGFSHKVSTPHYPQSNGKVEATVKSMKRIIRISWNRQSLNEDKSCRALLQYRNTPSCKDSLSPAQKLYGRPPHPGHHTSSPPILFSRMATQSRSSRTSGTTDIKILQRILQPTRPRSSGNSNWLQRRHSQQQNKTLGYIWHCDLHQPTQTLSC